MNEKEMGKGGDKGNATATVGAPASAADFAAMKDQLAALQSQLTAAVVGGAIRAPFAPPPKKPKGLAKWEVFVRHTCLPPGLKRAIVEADGEDAAWAKFLDAADKALTHNRMNHELRTQTNTAFTPQERFAWVRDEVNAGKAWVAQARLKRPDDAELTGAAYVAARRDALTVKGTVTREQIGFEELVTAK